MNPTTPTPDPKLPTPTGKIGYALLWLVGIPVPVLLAIFLLRGCN